MATLTWTPAELEIAADERGSSEETPERTVAGAPGVTAEELALARGGGEPERVWREWNAWVYGEDLPPPLTH